MSGLGAGLQSLGQSLDPARLSMAMRNMQEIQIREQEQQAFQKSLSQYDQMLSKGSDPQTAALWKSGEKMHPAHRSSFKNHQTFRATMAPAMTAWQAVQESQEDLGFTPEDLEDIHRRIKVNPQQAPHYVAQLFEQKQALVQKQAVMQEVNTGLSSAASGVDINTVYSSLSPAAQGLFAEKYKEMRSLDPGLGDDIKNTIEGVRMLAQGIEGFNDMTLKDQMAALQEANPAAFKDLGGAGQVSNALQEMQAQQREQATRVGEGVATREQELAGGKTILGEPVRVAVAEGDEAIDEIRVPGLVPQSSGFLGVGEVPTNIGPVKVKPTDKGRVHRFPIVDVLLSNEGRPSFTDPKSGLALTERQAVSRIMSDLASAKGSHGKATNLSEAGTVLDGIKNDYEGLLTGIRKVSKSGELPENILDTMKVLEDDIQGKLDKLILRPQKGGQVITLPSGRTKTLSTTRAFKMNKSDFRKKLAEELLGLKLFQTKYADIFRNY